MCVKTWNWYVQDELRKEDEEEGEEEEWLLLFKLRCSLPMKANSLSGVTEEVQGTTETESTLTATMLVTRKWTETSATEAQTETQWAVSSICCWWPRHRCGCDACMRRHATPPRPQTTSSGKRTCKIVQRHRIPPHPIENWRWVPCVARIVAVVDVPVRR